MWHSHPHPHPPPQKKGSVEGRPWTLGAVALLPPLWARPSGIRAGPLGAPGCWTLWAWPQLQSQSCTSLGELPSGEFGQQGDYVGEWNGGAGAALVGAAALGPQGEGGGRAPREGALDFSVRFCTYTPPTAPSPLLSPFCLIFSPPSVSSPLGPLRHQLLP